MSMQCEMIESTDLFQHVFTVINIKGSELSMYPWQSLRKSDVAALQSILSVVGLKTSWGKGGKGHLLWVGVLHQAVLQVFLIPAVIFRDQVLQAIIKHRHTTNCSALSDVVSRLSLRIDENKAGRKIVRHNEPLLMSSFLLYHL